MKRRIAIIVVFLLLGAVVNVAVAWGCVFFSAPPFVIRTYPDPTTGRYLIRTWDLFEESDLSWLADVPSDWPTRPKLRRGESTLGLTLHRAWGEGVTVRVQTLVAAGLPFRSLFAERHARFFISLPPRRDQFWASTTWRDGFEIPPRANGVRQVDLLPTLPLWPGFIINTLFYALLLWLLFAAPCAARRMHRRRRGLCEKCAYPVGVSPVCTECGTAVRRLDPPERRGVI